MMRHALIGLLAVVMSIFALNVGWMLWQTSDNQIMKTAWKYHHGDCSSDTFSIIPSHLELSQVDVTYRWLDASVFITLKDTGCTYISK